MTKSQSRAAQASRNGGDAQFEAIVEMNGKNLEIAEQAGRSALQSAMEMNQAIADFVNARLKKDMEALHGLTSCKSLSDACRQQVHFLGQTLRDYADQTERMLNITTGASLETIEAAANLAPSAAAAAKPSRTAPAAAERAAAE